MFFQILIDLLLAMELGGLRVEIHTNPGAMRRSLSLLLRRGLSFVCIADCIGFLPLRHNNGNEEKQQRYVN